MRTREGETRVKKSYPPRGEEDFPSLLLFLCVVCLLLCGELFIFSLQNENLHILNKLLLLYPITISDTT